jgi:hypothetical protein
MASTAICVVPSKAQCFYSVFVVYRKDWERVTSGGYDVVFGSFPLFWDNQGYVASQLLFSEASALGVPC